MPTSPKEVFQLDDMLLTEEQVPSALRAKFGLPEVSTEEINFETAGKRDERYRWPDRTLNYDLSQVVNPEDKTRIRTTLNILEKKFDGCLRFREATSGYRVVVVDNGRCQSRVGFTNSSDNQELSLNSPWCMIPETIEHEFMHAIGVQHTHSRPDRHNYVKIIKDNIEPKEKHNFEQLKETEYNTFGLPYDYLSLMHYDAFAFSKEEGRLITIETFDDPSKQDIIGHAQGVSAGDIDLVKAMYKCYW